MNGAGAIDAADTAHRSFNGDLNALPAALRLISEKDQWVVWLWTRSNSGKWTKPPLQARFPHRRARNNDPATWSSHAAAARRGARREVAGAVATSIWARSGMSRHGPVQSNGMCLLEFVVH